LGLTHIDACDWIDRTRVILEHGTECIVQPVDREAGFTRFRDWKLRDLLDRFAPCGPRTPRRWPRWSRPKTLSDGVSIPPFGEVTLGQLLATWVVHDLNHLGQIVKTMAKQYTQAIGPWREFLPIVNAP
jgi:hypothetical protein